MPNEALDFVLDLRLQGKADNTLLSYKYDLETFFNHVQKDPREVTKDDIYGFTKYQVELGAKATTINRRLSAIRQFFRYLKHELEVPTEIKFKKIEGRKKPFLLPKHLTQEQIEQVSSSLKKTKHKIVFFILYSTGIRVSELCNLRWEDIDNEDYTMRINNGKGGKDRIIVFGPMLAEMLDEWRPQCKSHIWVVPNQYLSAPLAGSSTTRAVQIMLKTIGKKVELVLTPHMLRHSYATHMLEGGASVRAVQELLGHTKLTTTQVYTQVAQTYVREQYDKAMSGE